MYCFCRLYVSKLLVVHIFKLFYTFPLLPIHNLPSGMQGKSVSSAKISASRDQPRFPQNAPAFAPPLSLMRLSQMPTNHSQNHLLSLPLNMSLVPLQTATLLTMKTISISWRQNSFSLTISHTQRRNINYKWHSYLPHIYWKYSLDGQTAISKYLSSWLISTQIELFTLDSYWNWRSFVYKTFLPSTPEIST